MFQTIDGAKRAAQALRKTAADHGVDLPLTRCQQLVVQHIGYRDWRDATSRLGRQRPIISRLGRDDGVADILAGLGVAAGHKPLPTAPAEEGIHFFDRPSDPILEQACLVQATAIRKLVDHLAPGSRRRLALIATGIVLGILPHLPMRVIAAGRGRISMQAVPLLESARLYAAEPDRLRRFLLEQAPTAFWSGETDGEVVGHPAGRRWADNLRAWPEAERKIVLEFWENGTDTVELAATLADLEALLPAGAVTDPYPHLPRTAPEIDMPWLCPRPAHETAPAATIPADEFWRPCDAFFFGRADSGILSSALLMAGRVASLDPYVQVRLVSDGLTDGLASLGETGAAYRLFPAGGEAMIADPLLQPLRPTETASHFTFSPLTEVPDYWRRLHQLDVLSLLIAKNRIPSQSGAAQAVDLVLVENNLLTKFPTPFVETLFRMAAQKTRFWFVGTERPSTAYISVLTTDFARPALVEAEYDPAGKSAADRLTTTRDSLLVEVDWCAWRFVSPRTLTTYARQMRHSAEISRAPDLCGEHPTG